MVSYLWRNVDDGLRWWITLVTKPSAIYTKLIQCQWSKQGKSVTGAPDASQFSHKSMQVRSPQIYIWINQPYSWQHQSFAAQIAKFMGPTWGPPRGAHLGPVGPRWAPCWPHEPCYQGGYVSCPTDSPMATKMMRWWKHLRSDACVHGF